MVEGCRNEQVALKPAAPVKKFYKKQSEESSSDLDTDVPLIPPRPLQAPKLPIRPSARESKDLVCKNSFPLEDNIYTGLKPELIVNKQIPVDFLAKALVQDEMLIGLQQGKISWLSMDKSPSDNGSDGNNSMNRQFYELIPFDIDRRTFLAFQDTGNVFKAHLENQNLSINLLLRASIPFGSAKVLLRPEIEEVWVVGLRETSILRLNRKEGDVALVKRVPSHFPEATSLTFLGAEDLAITQRNRSIQVFTVSRLGHQPALIANLPPVIGDVVKIVKISANAYGTIYSDGKMVVWRYENGELIEKISVPLTLFRIQSAHIAGDSVWLGLSNGKLLIIKIESIEKQIILAEAKIHQTAISKFIKCDDGAVLTLDAGGMLCTWDEKLTFYNQNCLIWDREADYCRYERVSLRICSWNAAAQNPFDCSDSVAKKWLGIEQGEEDLLVISLQEIVDLNARSFISSSNGNGTNQSQSALEQWIRFIQKNLPSGYKLVHSSTMVGLALIVFCRDGVKGSLSSVSDDAVKTGLGGLHGNKGGLVWRAFIYDCPVAFMACHLSAGQTSVSERNNDAATILRTAALADATTSRKDQFAFATGNGGTRLFDHSAIFMAGDLNYRIEMDRRDCLELISEGNLEILEEKDQLNAQMRRKELLLSYFREKQPRFAPTYKYDRGTVDRFDSSEKARIPAWCDRILFYSKKPEIIQISRYESIPEATLSDHKPIFGVFELKCRRIDEQIRSNLFPFTQK